MPRPRNAPPSAPADAADTADTGGVAVADAPEPATTEATEAAAQNPTASDTATSAPEMDSATSVASDASTNHSADESTVLSYAERCFLSRQNAILTAASNVELAQSELGSEILVLEDAKKRVKGKEAALEAAHNTLLLAVTGDPTPEQGTLPFEQGDATEALANSRAAQSQDEWDAKWEAFQDQPVTAPQVGAGIIEKLGEHSPSPIQTLRQLTAIKSDPHNNRGYQVIAGIGEGKADQLDTAYENLLQAFLKLNPNPANGAPNGTPTAETDAAPVAADYDFESTFPPAVNPTPNESYDDSYHNEVITTAFTEAQELASFKAQLSAGDAELSPAKRKKLETKLGETQFQFDEGFTLYAEKFGDKAAAKLRVFVEAKVDRVSKLKGGIE